MAINRACIILWCVIFAVGMWLAMHKPLWCDELYGQKVTIEGSSWGKILTGRINNEGNNFPLYYAIQKAVTSTAHFNLPDELIKDFELPTEKRKYNLFVYPKGQILLRLLPDALTSSAIVFLVRFFWIREGIVVGFMAFLSALTSGMVWRYWVEARPYPLWFLLTLLQALFLIQLITESGPSSRVKIRLMICHWLLAVTAPLGFIQVIIAQAVLFQFGQRRLMDHLWAGILPVCGVLFFLNHRSSSALYMGTSPIGIIWLNFSYEQLSLLFFYFMALICLKVWVCNNTSIEQRPWKGLAHFSNLLMGFCLSIMIIAYIYWRWPQGQNGFPVLGRHFYFLSALTVVMVPSMFSDLWLRSKGSPFWRGVFLVFFTVLLISQFIGSFGNAWVHGFYQ